MCLYNLIHGEAIKPPQHKGNDMNLHVTRRATKVLTAKGAEYKSCAAAYNRRHALELGLVSPRIGEKIVGSVSKYQSGVRTSFGDFSKHYEEITFLRLRKKQQEELVNPYFCGSNPTPRYFENQVSRALESAKYSTKYRIKQYQELTGFLNSNI